VGCCISEILENNEKININIKQTKNLFKMKQELVEKAYALAKERYAAIGVDTDKAIEALINTPISLHCWQADDVTGFESGSALTGGIQATGNHVGKARNIDELRADVLKAKSYIGGNHRLNLHEIYGEFGGKKVDRDEVEPKYFEGWMQWAKENNFKLDFNSTSFSHPKSGNLSLANPDKSIREFWIEHTKRCRAISDAIGKAQNDPCIMNIWIHDGSKDQTVEKLRYRELLKESLDEILATKYDHMKSCLEAKLFGIGLESFTVGSYDFYLAYCAKNNVICTLDTGHFVPTESVADKVSSLLLFIPELMLHVSRPIRWDSDHVTIFNDDTQDLFKELVRANGLSRTHIGLDYFDASINRIGAYVVGARATQKCILHAMLEPLPLLRKYEDNDQLFERLAQLEEDKSMPWGAVYDEFCLRTGVPVGEEFIADIQKYEHDVLIKRV
jgi:L-rhamnose isomerase